MANPSIRICNASIYIVPAAAAPAASLKETARHKKSSRKTIFRELFARSVGRDLDEAWELQFGLGDVGRPDRDLLTILPLQHQTGNQALAILDRVGERIVLAIELRAAD